MKSSPSPNPYGLFAASKCIKSTNEAFRKIVNANRSLSFFVGAGISFPDVPLASEIVEKLARERIYPQDNGWQRQIPNDEELDFLKWKEKRLWLTRKDSYSQAVLEAFGRDQEDVIAMNEYFDREFLATANPNFNHFALALLMKYNFVNKTCITTNFDRLLEAAFMRIGGCDCIPLRTEVETDLWDHYRHYILKVHGDGHYYNMRHTASQTSKWDDNFNNLILNNRTHFSGLVVVGLGGHDQSVRKFFKAYRDECQKPSNRTKNRGVFWAIRTGKELAAANHDQLVQHIQAEVNDEIIDIFMNAAENELPFYFFPIKDGRHFFYYLVKELVKVKPGGANTNAEIERFQSEIRHFYGGDEWVYSRLESAKLTLGLTQQDRERYLDKLKMANDRLKSAKQHGSRVPREWQSRSYQESKVRLEVGDICESKSDILVSSDDVLIMMNGGVASEIRTRGGEQIIQDIQKFGKFRLNPSEILVTTAGRLNAKYVFHAAILHPKETAQNFPLLVRDAVNRCLELMVKIPCKSIAFPLLASGTAQTRDFGPRESANGLFEAIRSFLDANLNVQLDITICVYDESIMRNNQLEPLFLSFFS